MKHYTKKWEWKEIVSLLMSIPIQWDTLHETKMITVCHAEPSQTHEVPFNVIWEKAELGGRHVLVVLRPHSPTFLVCLLLNKRRSQSNRGQIISCPGSCPDFYLGMHFFSDFFSGHLEGRKGQIDLHVIRPTFWEARHGSKWRLKRHESQCLKVFHWVPPKAEGYTQTCTDSSTVILGLLTCGWWSCGLMRC
jgi:hypothetical protein